MSAQFFVGNIQRFCLQDGPGIRTTIFLKGCALHCPWCCNPENISFGQTTFRGKPYGCAMCVEEVFDEIVKDKPYYADGGGVTFSGGEPLLQAEPIEKLCDLLRRNHISSCVETSLFVPSENIDRIIRCIDLFYVDIKILNKAKCEQEIGGDIDLFLHNLKLIQKSEAPMVFRVPVIAGRTDNQENFDLLLNLCREFEPVSIDILAGHNFGDAKYTDLGLNVPASAGVEEDTLLNLKEQLGQAGLSAKIFRT